MPPVAKSAIRTQFWELLFKDYKGWLCIATKNPKAPIAGFSQKFFKWPNEWAKVEDHILKVEKAHDVYFCVSLLKEAIRKKEHCLSTDLLWADLDDVKPDKLTLRPPIVIQSSPGRWQALWRLTTKLPSWQAEDYAKRIAYLSGADKSGWDAVQLLRVPLTKNFKYDGHPEIELLHALETQAQPLLFEKFFPPVTTEEPVAAMPDEEGKEFPTLDEILYKYQRFLPSDFQTTFTYEPEFEEDWSSRLWKLLHMCLKSGMTAEETFIVARSAACNKYARDGRPIEHLWRDVLKAASTYEGSVQFSNRALITMPDLVAEPASETFIDQYREWASEATDAVIEFHDLCSFVLISAIASNSVRLETSAGRLVPNIWGLLLGDSTLTRKTTAMQMALSFIFDMQSDLVLATDGSAEGLLTGLSLRPNKTSIFHKDEVSGFFDSMNRKSYLAGMQETLTALYDVPHVMTRMLRSETLTLESPAFIFLGGGVTDRVYAACDENYVLSGFLPRFLVVEGNKAERRALGPPTEQGAAKRMKIQAKVAQMLELYAVDVEQKIGGHAITQPLRVKAVLTSEAWQRNTEFEDKLVGAATDSAVPGLALPTFDRLSRSLLKMAMCLAASRQAPKKNTIMVTGDDMVNAAWYVQQWGRHSVKLILNAGTQESEKQLESIYRAIQRKPAILRSELMRSHHLNKRETDLVMDTLEERGMIRKERRGGGTAYWPA